MDHTQKALATGVLVGIAHYFGHQYFGTPAGTIGVMQTGILVAIIAAASIYLMK